MALKADHSDMPSVAEGNVPDAKPRYGGVLADAWAAAYVDEGDRPMATPDARVRASWAGKCARDIAYRMLHVEPSNPPDLAGFWRMGIGTMVHERLQSVFEAAFPGAQCEHLVGWTDELEAQGASSIDIFLVTTGDIGGERRTVIEVKTVNGFGFKKMVGARGPAEGPRFSAVLQGALSAVAMDADELVVIYLSLECLSDRELGNLGGPADPARKFLAEWTFSKDEFTPLALREGKRLAKITQMIDTLAEDVTAPLPPRSIPNEMPVGARITNPAKGTWALERDGKLIMAGETWMCGYCDHRDRCITDAEAGN